MQMDHLPPHPGSNLSCGCYRQFGGTYLRLETGGIRADELRRLAAERGTGVSCSGTGHGTTR